MRLSVVFLALIYTAAFQAKGNQCLDGSPKNQTFINALRTSTAPLVMSFRQQSGFNISEGRVGCRDGVSCSGFTTQQMKLGSNFTGIPKECITASLKRKVVQNSIECIREPNGNWGMKRHSKRSKTAPCIDDTTVDYIHHTTNKVISCFQGLPMKNGVVESVDPKLLYSKINNESGFNFSFSYDGGVGAGQVTGHAVQEMNVLNPSRTNGRVVKGGGRFILDSILNSSKSDCVDLKSVIKNDLKFGYHSPRKPNCEWVSMETGLARNLIYSMGYFAFLKHQIIGKELRRIAPNAYKDAELLNLLTMVGYGPKGTNRALTLIRTLNMGSAGSSLASIKAQLKKQTYLNSTATKLKEAKAKAGGTCHLL
jgi:hypothetical protein